MNKVTRMNKVVGISKVVDGPLGRASAYGVIVDAQTPDLDNEISEWPGVRDAVHSWSDESAAQTRAAGQEVSLGNIRLQHDSGRIAGKATQIVYDDAKQTVSILAVAVDDEISEMLRGGFIKGFSIAGGYQSRKCAVCQYDMLGGGHFCPNCGQNVLVRYVPGPIVETSFVDAPCVPTATFQYVKNGKIEVRKFQTNRGDSAMAKSNKFADAVNKAASAHKALSALHSKMADASTGATKSFHKAVSAEHSTLAGAHADIGALVDQDLGVLQDPPTYPDSDFRAPGGGGTFEDTPPTGTRPYGDPVERVAKEFLNEFFGGQIVTTNHGISSMNYAQRLTKGEA